MKRVLKYHGLLIIRTLSGVFSGNEISDLTRFEIFVYSGILIGTTATEQVNHLIMEWISTLNNLLELLVMQALTY